MFESGPVNTASMGTLTLKVATLAHTKGWTEAWYELVGKNVRQGKVYLLLPLPRLRAREVRWRRSREAQLTQRGGGRGADQIGGGVRQAGA